ncbi:MAG: hypothetical protein WC294_05565, partial [Methanoregula sp.]
ASDRLVQDVRPGSPVMDRLRTAGLRSDITYRIIVTINPEHSFGFFPWFDGKTCEIGDDGRYRATLNGDGVVPHRESVLPGISLDIIPALRMNRQNIFLLRTSTAPLTCRKTHS